VDGVNGNVYLVIAGEELTLVDTGMPKNTEKILGYIRELGWQPSDVSRILLTHFHIDHAGSAYEIRKLTNAKIAIHQEDADFVSGKKPAPIPKDFPRNLPRASSSFSEFTPVQPDITLKQNDKVGALTVIHTPGHTPGSISLYDPDRRLLFVGDAIRYTEGRITGPPEQFTLDMQQATRSIEIISQLNFDVMLSGHGEPLKPNASVRVREFYSTLSI